MSATESLILGATLALIGTVIGSIVTYFLDRSNNKRELLLQAKKEVYSKIIAGINSSYIYEKDNLPALLSDPNYKTKMKIRVGKLFSQGRLLADKGLSDKLRELFNLECKTWDDPNHPAPDLERVKVAHEIEDLMKREITK